MAHLRAWRSASSARRKIRSRYITDQTYASTDGSSPSVMSSIQSSSCGPQISKRATLANAICGAARARDSSAVARARDTPADRDSKTGYHSAREQVGLAFGVAPEQEVAHLVIQHLDPLALAEVDAPAFPILGMYEMDAAVFVSAAGGFAPIDILEPFDARAAQFEISAHRGDGAIEMRGAMAAEKFGQVAINFAAMHDRRNNHSHEPR